MRGARVGLDRNPLLNAVLFLSHIVPPSPGSLRLWKINSRDKAAHVPHGLLLSLEIEHEAPRTPRRRARPHHGVLARVLPIDCISASSTQLVSGSGFSPREPKRLSLDVCSDQLRSYTCPLGRGGFEGGSASRRASLLPCPGSHRAPPDTALPAKTRANEARRSQGERASRDLPLDRVLIIPWLPTFTSFGGGCLDSCWGSKAHGSFGNER